MGSQRADVEHQVFKEAPKSWNVVFEERDLPDGKSNKGRVQAYDGPIHVADAANYLMFHKPELGIKDPYELNEDQYKAALDLLRVQRTLVGRYWHDDCRDRHFKTKASSLPARGRSRSISWPSKTSPSPPPSRRRAPPAGPTRP